MDLNLFRVFDAIYRAGSLTEAARDLHLSQPAVSNALSRLREHFDDPLFVRRGRSIAPTPVADTIADDIQSALSLLQDSVHRGQHFEPSASQRRFVLGLGDTMEFLLLPPLIKQLSASAPGLSIHSRRLRRDQLSRHLALGELSLAVDVPQTVDSSIEQRPLRSEPLCVLMRADHPLAAHALTMEGYLQARHIGVSGRREGALFEDIQLQQQGFKRQVQVRGQSYHAACHVVVASSLLLTLPQQLGERYADLLGLALQPLPVLTPTLDMTLYWHRSANADAGHRWLREQLIALAATL